MKYQDVEEIPRSLIKLGEKLGSGSFGTVFKGEWKGKDVAIKTRIQNNLFGMTEDEFLEEAKYMSNLDHKNLVKCHGKVKLKNSTGIVMEYMCKGSLEIYFTKNEGKSSTFPDLIYMAEQVASGLAYMELKKYLHSDIHSGNILVGENRVCKIADFGRVQYLDYSRYIGAYRSIFSTIMAPELKTGGSYTIESDVYHFGFLMHGIFTKGKCWFGPIKPKGSIKGCTAELFDKMTKCFSNNPSDRPSFKELESFLKNSRNEIGQASSKQANDDYASYILGAIGVGFFVIFACYIAKSH